MSSRSYDDTLAYRAPYRPVCAAGEHAAFTTTDRDGAWFWACYRCPAVRVQGDPVWRTP